VQGARSKSAARVGQDANKGKRYDTRFRDGRKKRGDSTSGITGGGIARLGSPVKCTEEGIATEKVMQQASLPIAKVEGPGRKERRGGWPEGKCRGPGPYGKDQAKYRGQLIISKVNEVGIKQRGKAKSTASGKRDLSFNMSKGANDGQGVGLSGLEPCRSEP